MGLDPVLCAYNSPQQILLSGLQAVHHRWWQNILLTWPKKFGQPRTSNYRRVHAREITRLCPLAGARLSQFFLARVVVPMRPSSGPSWTVFSENIPTLVCAIKVHPLMSKFYLLVVNIEQQSQLNWGLRLTENSGQHPNSVLQSSSIFLSWNLSSLAQSQDTV